MNTRAVQKTGGSSFSITLPKQWMEQMNLTERDTLEYYFDQKGPLFFRPILSGNQPHRKLYLDIDYLTNEHIAREIYGMFIFGVDEIVIRSRSFSHEQRSFIRKLSYRLIGFELFESTTNSITLRNISSRSISTREYMQKIYTNILSMYSDVIKTVQQYDLRLARDIIERDVEIDRIYMLVSRRLHILLREYIPESGSTESLVAMQYNNLITVRLERIADLILRIAYSLLLLRPSERISLTPAELHTFTATTEYLDLLRTIIFESDKRSAHKLLDMHTAYIKTELLKKHVVNKPYCNIRIIESIERIRGYSANIAEETIDYSYSLANIDMNAR